MSISRLKILTDFHNVFAVPGSSKKKKKSSKSSKKKKGKKGAEGPDPAVTSAADMCAFFGFNDVAFEYTDDEFQNVTSLKVRD